MVDALREVHRILAPGGVVVDARPDSRVAAKVLLDGRLAGTVGTRRLTSADDRASDDAIARVKRERLFRSLRRGRLWHRFGFDSPSELRRYLADHLRFSPRATWRVPRSRRSGAAEIERAVRFEVLERI